MVGVANMMASRGMGDIAPSKMPGAKKKARRDDTDFTQFKEGGKVKSKVNAAGNYTKPELRKRIFNSVKAAAIVGTGAGQWSARKAQVMAKRYKAAGGGYRD
jgi:putative N-acetylmannosamine-6-phosphate epimerase